MPLESGTMLGRILVEEQLGAGGMSEVYRGYDVDAGRSVALKVIRERRRLHTLAKARFLREAKILSRLEHPGLCRVYDLIVGDEQDVMVLELVEGRNLRRLLGDGLDEDEALRIGQAIAEIFVVTHGVGIVHRDLKPENVMVTGDGVVKILDFDLARPVEGVESDLISLVEAAHQEVLERAGSDPGEETQTRLGSIVGTVLYMSPEQARGESLTVAADLYSLGIVLHEMLTGEQPYPGKVGLQSRLLQVADGRALILEHGDRALVRLVEGLKSLDPERRPSAAATVTALAAARKRRARGARWSLSAVLDRLARSVGRGEGSDDRGPEVAKGG